MHTCMYVCMRGKTYTWKIKKNNVCIKECSNHQHTQHIAKHNINND